MDQRTQGLFLSAVTVADVCNGISRLERNGVAAGAAQLTGWLDSVIHFCGDRVIPFDIDAARLAGTLKDQAPSLGHSPGFADPAIAATAGSRDLTVLTRNVGHFAPLGVRVIDPLESLPPGPNLSLSAGHFYFGAFEQYSPGTDTRSRVCMSSKNTGRAGAASETRAAAAGGQAAACARGNDREVQDLMHNWARARPLHSGQHFITAGGLRVL